MPYCHPDVFDDGLNEIKNNATAQHVCSAEPTTRAEAISLSLGTVDMTSGDFTLGNGDVSGRKITMAQKSTTATGDGTITSIAVIDGSRLLLASSTVERTLVTSDPLTFPAWDFELRQPTT